MSEEVVGGQGMNVTQIGTNTIHHSKMKKGCTIINNYYIFDVNGDREKLWTQLSHLSEQHKQTSREFSARAEEGVDSKTPCQGSGGKLSARRKRQRAKFYMTLRSDRAAGGLKSECKMCQATDAHVKQQSNYFLLMHLNGAILTRGPSTSIALL
ncbi:uncharacterized protein [Haliotis cracherodii]|uniref:uncharacterized protein n=1 Tax=Haliotis cracherodii TaxID=6455 RepID=UPI0039EB4D57